MGEHVIIFRHRTKAGPLVRVVVEPLDVESPEAGLEAALAILREVYETSSQRAEIRREERTRVFADTLGPME